MLIALVNPAAEVLQKSHRLHMLWRFDGKDSMGEQEDPIPIAYSTVEIANQKRYC